MGGFASSFETAASSGANNTFSGVPVGNSVGGDGGGFAPASSFSTSSALPETGGGNFGGDWSSQAFAPSSMTQPLPEPSLPETIDWKPQPVPETLPRNQLENVAPNPAAGNGLLAENTLLQKTGESETLHKANPILSKLAREHPENPVHLKGGLLGAPEPAQPQIKPPNPFSQKDELPKLPKIDWGAYDKHRIDGKTRISHDDWARIITGTKDFGGIMPTMIRTVNDGGDGGRGNVADVLWRVAQKNPDHARFFQGELTKALGDEMIPIRRALMQGDVSPAQLVDPAKSPGLLGTAKPNRFADPDFEKSYWQSAEAYKAEFEQRRQNALQQTSDVSEQPRHSQAEKAYPPMTEPPPPYPLQTRNGENSPQGNKALSSNAAQESRSELSRAWTTEKKPEDIIKEARSNGGYLNTQQDRDRGNSQECTALVKHITGVGPAGTWKEGDKLNGSEKPPLQPGTALATFRNGVYENKETGNHAAIFLQYDVQNGKKGMVVLDQWRGQPAHTRFIPFDDSRPSQNNAGAYSVIRR